MAQPEEYTFRWKVRKGEYGDVCCSVSGFIKHRAQTVGTLEGTLIARGVNAYNSGLRRAFGCCLESFFMFLFPLHLRPT